MSSRRRAPSSGSTSNVPRGAWIFSATAISTRELGEERIGRALGAEARHAHVTGVNGRVLGQRVDQAADRLEQRAPVAARQVRTADRPLKKHVSGEDDV